MLLTSIFVCPNKSEAFRLMTNNVTILNETNLFNEPNQSNEPIGTLGAIQSLAVDMQNTENNPSMVSTKDGDWIRVQTWLGPNWIKDNDSVVYGNFAEVIRYVTIMNIANLYDSPSSNTNTGQRLAPQKVKITASLTYMPKDASSALSVALSSGTWYRVQTTWMGDKWINNPAILEDVKENPTTMQLKLMDKEKVYPVPYITADQGEIIPPGVVDVIATSTEGWGPWSSVWYKLQLPQGVRWMRPEHKILTNYRVMKESVQLKTAARYFDEPKDDLNIDNNNLLSEGNYQAIEASGGWVHLETSFGLKWVNLDRVLIERPEGIVPTSDKVELTKDTETYYFPNVERVCHIRGFFAPQQVQAFEKWEAKDGSTWYHINTFSGQEWIQVKKL